MVTTGLVPVLGLPEDAVGEGARWRATTRLELAGIEVRETYTYTLARRDETGVELGVKHVQKARRGPADLPGIPDDVDVTITDYDVRGSRSLPAGTRRVAACSREPQRYARQAFRRR
jgi:hypothetical protein